MRFSCLIMICLFQKGIVHRSLCHQSLLSDVGGYTWSLWLICSLDRLGGATTFQTLGPNLSDLIWEKPYSLQQDMKGMLLEYRILHSYPATHHLYHFLRHPGILLNMYIVLRSPYTIWCCTRYCLSISVLAEPWFVGADAICWACCKDLLLSEAWTRQQVAHPAKRLELLDSI